MTPPPIDPSALPPSLDADATRRALPFGTLLAELERAVLQLDEGRIRCPERLVVPMADGALLLSMPAVADDLASHKLITVVPGNTARGLPTISGQVTVLDARTGRTLLTLDGPTVTGRRTAAISMLGLKALWPQGPKALLLIGTGTQAGHHLEALAALHPGVQVAVRGSSATSAQRFCERHAGLGLALRTDDGPCAFDVVITCTTSRQPVYAEPAHSQRLLIAVGAFQPAAAEIAATTVQASTLYVDDPGGARHEAGDLLQARIDWARVHSLAHALRHGPASGSPLLFKSVGCAAWDLAAARTAVRVLHGPSLQP